MAEALPATSLPQPDGVAALGSTGEWSDGGHVHPGRGGGYVVNIFAGMSGKPAWVSFIDGFNPSPITFAQNTAYFVPVTFSHSIPVQAMGVEIYAGIPSSTPRFGLYNDDPATGLPGSLVVDAGRVDGTAAGYPPAVMSFTPVAGRRYWTFVVPQGAGCSMVTTAAGSTQDTGPMFMPGATYANGGRCFAYAGFASGALPDPAGLVVATLTTFSVVPRFYFIST